MRNVVLSETVRRTVQQSVLWGIFFALMAALVIVIVPDVEELQKFASFFENVPTFLLAAAGVPGGDISFITSYEGFIAIGFFGKMILFFLAYPVVMGMRVTTNEEDQGSLDVLLSLPLKRRQLILEKFAAYVMTFAIITVCVILGVFAALQVSVAEVDMGRMAESILNLLPTLIFVLTFTILIGAIFRGNRIVLGIVTAFILSSFMLQTIGDAAAGSFAEGLRAISFLNYYNAAGVMQNGLNWANIIGLLAVSGIMLFASLWFFDRRDVGV